MIIEALAGKILTSNMALNEMTTLNEIRKKKTAFLTKVATATSNQNKSKNKPTALVLSPTYNICHPAVML